MPIHIDPGTRQRIISSRGNNDIVYETNTNQDVLDNEPVLVKGTWSDYTGSQFVSKYSAKLGGVANEMQGTTQGDEGAKFSTVNVFGKRTVNYRMRKKLKYHKF